MSLLIERALAAHEAGYDVVACHGKAPIASGWQRGGVTADMIRTWEGDSRVTNIGILAGTIVGLDLDILDGSLSERAKNLALQILGDTPLIRIGRVPKQLMVYRVPSPIRKRIAVGVVNGVQHKIEVLAQGQQFVAYGRHPDTMQHYAWPEADLCSIPAASVPETSEEALELYLAAVVEIIGPPPRPRPAPSPTPALAYMNGHGEKPDAEEVLAALHAIPGDLDYDEWIRVGFALYAALGHSAAGHWAEWSARSSKNVPATTSRKWPSFARNDAIHPETLFWIAREHGWKPEREKGPQAGDLGIFKAKVPRHDPETGEIFEEDETLAEVSDTGIPVSDAFPFDPSAIPLRDWVVPGLLLRRYLSVLVAPPGTGKSLIVLQVAIAAALEIEWAGWKPRKPARVLIVNAEDDLDEMRRRLHAACETMEVDPETLRGRIFLADTPEDMVIVKRGRRDEIQVTDLPARIASTCSRLQIDFIAIDPLAETHQLDENSNGDIKEVGRAWRQVARETATAVLLVHHTPKRSGAMAGDPDAARGGSALVGVARIVTTLFGMTDKEAEAMGIPEEKRREFVRFDDAKANYSLLSDKKWLQKHTVTIPNGPMGTDGDEVGALVPYETAGPFDGIAKAVVHALIETIAAGVTIKGRHQYYGAKRNTGDRDIVKLIQSRLGMAEERAKTVLKFWIKSGLLHEENYSDGHQERTGLMADPVKVREIIHGV